MVFSRGKKRIGGGPFLNKNQGFHFQFFRYFDQLQTNFQKKNVLVASEHLKTRRPFEISKIKNLTESLTFLTVRAK